jgi:hypothetical protein
MPNLCKVSRRNTSVHEVEIGSIQKRSQAVDKSEVLPSNRRGNPMELGHLGDHSRGQNWIGSVGVVGKVDGRLRWGCVERVIRVCGDSQGHVYNSGKILSAESGLSKCRMAHTTCNASCEVVCTCTLGAGNRRLLVLVKTQLRQRQRLRRSLEGSVRGTGSRGSASRA